MSGAHESLGVVRVSDHVGGDLRLAGLLLWEVLMVVGVLLMAVVVVLLLRGPAAPELLLIDMLEAVQTSLSPGNEPVDPVLCHLHHKRALCSCETDMAEIFCVQHSLTMCAERASG